MKKGILIISVAVCVCILAILGLNKFKSDSDNTSASATITSASSTIDPASLTIESASVNNSKVAVSDSSAPSTSSTSDNKATGGNTELSIGSGNGAAESTVIIPISIKTVPKEGIGICNFNIKYDTDILEVVEVLPGDAIEKNSSNLEYKIVDSTGLVVFLFSSSSDGKDSITKPGVISNVKFKIKKDAKKGVTKVTRGTAGAFVGVSGDKINAEFTDGEITVK